MKFNFLFLQFFCVSFCIFVTDCTGENVKKSVIDENRDDNGETNDEANSESMEVPVENEPNNVTCSRRQNSQMHEIKAAQHKQFPFVVAVMSDHNAFVCSGSVISNGLILTSALCTQQSISYVLLNATKAKKDETTIALHIIKTEKFPTFATSDSSDYFVGLIYTEKHNSSITNKIRLSSYTSTSGVVDFEAIGYGLNADVGQGIELQYIGLENRGFPIPSIDSRDLIRGYFDCIDTKVVTCFKDTGGPAIFDNELLGVVVRGQNECIKEMSSSYAVNKKIAEILPTYTFKAWLDHKIKSNEEHENIALATFPMIPARRSDMSNKMTRNAGSVLALSFNIMVEFIFLIISI